MSEEYISGNDLNDVAPIQQQSHPINTVSYLVASSLNPHNMKYVTVDADFCQRIIKKNNSTGCHHSSLRNITLFEASHETPSISPHSDKVSILGSHCRFVSRRNCPSGGKTDLSACTIDIQDIWPDLRKTENPAVIGQPGLDPILCEESIMPSADMSDSSFNIEPQNSKSCVNLCPSDQNMETVCQMKSSCIRTSIGRCSCSPFHEISAENSEKISMKEKKSSNGYSGQTQQQMDDLFLKTCRCRVCQHSFTDVFSLNFHIYKEHEKTSRPTCVRCSATLVSLYSLFRHLMKHKRLLLKEKAKMTKQFQRPDQHGIDPLIRNLTRELQYKDPETCPTFPCGACGKEYKHKKTLIAHVKLKHLGVQKKTYKCGFCFRLFASLWQKNNHLSWRHFGRKPYTCQFCDQGFVCLPTLKRHQRKIHTGERPYRCLQCGESFFEKTPLDLHKAQIHTGIFPFVCSQCGRGFVQRSYLTNHWKIHSGLRPYKCLVCGKKYSKISHLKRHKTSCCKKSGGKILINTTHLHME